VIAIALAVLNATTMTTRERGKEMAVMKTLGFTGGQILGEMALESSCVALIGGLLGIVVAAELLDRVRGFVPALGALLSFGLPAPVMAAGLVVAVAIGLAGGLAPAVGAVHTTIVDALNRIG